MKRRYVVTVAAAIICLLILNGITFAALKLTAPLHSWDDGQSRWENGNVTMYLDGQPQPFYEELGWDNVDAPNACGAGTSTDYAGMAEIGLYHIDSNPVGAPGFQSTSDWALVPCSVFDTKKYPDQSDILAECTADNNDGDVDRCEIVNQDQVSSCGTGNCQTEIVTHVAVNLDTDCDGNIDPGFTGDVCLYWTAEKPPLSGPYWGGNFQARINDGGGDKTLNFDIFGPNAISMQDFSVQGVSVPGAVLLAVFGLAVILSLGAMVLARRR